MTGHRAMVPRRIGLGLHGVPALPGEPDLERRLDRLIGERCRLLDLRRQIQSVSNEESEEAELASLLIDLLTSWFYSRPDEVRRSIVKARLQPLRLALTAGRWVTDLEGAQEVRLLSRRQTNLLARYRVAPDDVTRTLFEFDESPLSDRLDVYRPRSSG